MFSADTVVPISRPPLPDASVAARAGRILQVGERKRVLAAYPKAKEVRWHGVLIPGLVNTHTHLQYTGFSALGAMQFSGFEEWSIAFDELYATRLRDEDWLGAARSGAELAVRSGTTAIADICTDIDAVTAIRDAGLSGYTFFEVMGYDWREWRAGGRERVLNEIRTALITQTPTARIGISPHAPYSLDTPVLAELVELALEADLPVHTHLAESEFEDTYYRSGTGPLADFVGRFGREFQILREGGNGTSAAQFAASLGLLGRKRHVAHGIYVDPEDRAILRETRTPVALCPRSNAVIGLDPPPVAAYLEEGNAICVGTDSLASSPSLDLLGDVRALRDLALEQGYERSDLSRRLLEAATIGGAQALHMDSGRHAVGSIEPGKRADFAIFPTHGSQQDPETSIVQLGAGSCVATVVGGEIRFGDDESTVT